MARVFGWEDAADYEHAIDDLRLVVRADGRAKRHSDLEKARERLRADALVAVAAD